MNAAFLLVTTAWLAGADPAQPAPQAAPAATPAPVGAYAAPGAYAHGAYGGGYGGCGAGCSGGCDTCCDSCCDECGKGGLFGKLKGMFSRKSCCDTCESCCDSCGSGCGGGYGAAVASPIPLAPRGEAIPAPKSSEPPKAMPKEAPKDTEAAPKTGMLLSPSPVAPASSVSIVESKSPFELTRRYDSRGNHAADYSWVTGQLFYVHADGGLWLLRYAPLAEEDPNGGSIVLARDLSMDNYREGDLVTVHGKVINEHASKFLGGPLYRAETIQLIERKPQ